MNLKVSLIESYCNKASAIQDLKRVFWQYGELRTAPALARTIVEARQHKAIETTFELKTVLKI